MIFINDIKINNGFYFINENYNDIYYDIDIDTIDYIIGTNKEINYINKEIINLNIEPFASSHIINEKGINGGNLIINLKYNSIDKEKWDKLIDADKLEMIRIFKKLKNDIKI